MDKAEIDEWIKEHYGDKYPLLVEDERDPFWRPGK